MKIRKGVAAMATLGAGLTLSLSGLAGTAQAATGPGSNSGYGFDGNAHIIVGGGSDTTYKAMTAIAAIYDTSSIGGCQANTTPTNNTNSPSGLQLNQCLAADPAPGGSAGPPANFDRDTVVNAAPTGSTAGIASLNGYANNSGAGSYLYQGSANNGGTVDFARSSRAANTSTGACGGSNGTGIGNELVCDTFWGFAEDGVEVFGFGTHAGVQLTGAQVLGIYDCQYTTWGQVDGNASDTAPIVPFGMNTASGTYATMNTYLDSQPGAPSGFTVDSDAVAASTTYSPGGGKCVRQLSTGEPFENDVKPIFNDVSANQGGLTTSGNANDPDNWIWFGSYGLLSSFPYDNNFTTTSGTTYTGTADPIANAGGAYVAPSGKTIFLQTYPITRTLFHVTKSTDATCPTATNAQGQSACDFTDNPGPSIGSAGTDLNVLGGTSGTSGAVREFTRFICRPSGDDPVDPYTGNNLYTEVQAARGSSGFTAVPSALITSGSACAVTP